MNVRPLKRWFFAGTIAAVIAAVWCTLLFPAPDFPHSFLVEVKSPGDVVVRISYQRGAGWRESESAHASVKAGGHFTLVTLPLPPGKYRGIRFQPIGGAGSVTFRNAQVVTYYGHTIRRFSPEDFSSNLPSRSHQHRGETVTVTAPSDADVPQLSVDFHPILRLALGFWSRTKLTLPRCLFVFGFCLGCFAFVESSAWLWRHRTRLPAVLRSLGPHRPRRTLALLSLVAAILASYPVVFCGMSFVSPNNGAVLLYEGSPTVPGVTDRRAEDIHGTDVGAMMWQHLPYTVVEHRALSEGALPLWNRYSSLGVTLFGQGQSMFGDPFHLLVIAANGASWAFDAKFVLMKALFAFGLGWCAWILTRDWGVSILATFGGAFVAFYNFRINHPTLFSESYAPWILVAWFEMIQARDRRTFRWAIVLWAVANWIELASGTVKEAYLLCLCLNFTGAFAFLLQPAPSGQKLRRTAAVGAAGFAFALLSAPLWWTFLDALSTSVTTYDSPRVYQIPSAWLIGLFDDVFYRDFHPEHGISMPTANLLFLIGCLAALARGWRLIKTPAVLAVFASALVAVAFAFGWVPPEWILHLPFLRNIYYINAVFSWIAVVYVCILGSWGFAAARQAIAAGRTKSLLGLMLLGLAVLLFIFFNDPFHRLWTDRGRWAGDWIWKPHYQMLRLALASLPLAGGLLWFATFRAAHRRARRRWTFAIVAVAAALLAARHGQHLPLRTSHPYISAPAVRGNLSATSPAVEYLQFETESEPGRVIGTRNNFFPGFATVYGLEGANGPNALDNRQYREFVEAAGLADPGSWRFNLLFPENLQAWRPFLDFFNVRFIGAPPDFLPSDVPGYDRVARLDFDLYRSQHAWPRAFFSNRIEHYHAVAELVAHLRKDSPAPFLAIQDNDSAATKAIPAIGPGVGRVLVAAHDYRLEANTTTFSIAAPGPGVIALHESWLDQDFRTTVNGHPVPYIRVNHLFKGIVVHAAGDYVVSFTYWPHHFTAALVLWASGLLLLAGVLFAVGRLLPVSAEPLAVVPTAAIPHSTRFHAP